MKECSITFRCPDCGYRFTIIGNPSLPEELIGDFLQRKPICENCNNSLKNKVLDK